MRFTAFEPPPPTPTTTIRAETSPSPFTVASMTRALKPSLGRVSLREEASQPLFHPNEETFAAWAAEVVRLSESPLQQSNARGIGRVADRFDQSEHSRRRADPDGRVEHLRRQPSDALELGRAADQHDPARNAAIATGASQVEAAALQALPH